MQIPISGLATSTPKYIISTPKRYKAYAIALSNGFLQIDDVRYMEDLEPLDLEFIKLGFQDVLYNPKTKQIYTPNTDKTSVMGAENTEKISENEL